MLWHTRTESESSWVVCSLVGDQHRRIHHNGVVLRETWGQAMQALGKPAQLSGGAIVIFNIWGFLVGIATVWLYAAIPTALWCRTKTAIRAGLVTWVRCRVSP